MTGLTIGAAALDGSDEGDDVIINPYRFASAGPSGAFHTPSQGWLAAYLADDSGAADGATATPIPELSGGSDLTALATAPTFDVDGVGAQPAYEFAANGAAQNTTDPTFSATTLSLVCVFRSNVTGIREWIVSVGAFADLMFEATSSNTWSATRGGGSVSFGTTDTEDHIVIFDTGSASDVYFDGANVRTFSGSEKTFTSLSLILGTEPSQTRYFNGRIAFVGFATGRLSTPDREAIEAWAGAKYGITIA